MTTLTASSNAFRNAKPHALATILGASEPRRIVAVADIFDLSGTKLWARHQPVSTAWQRKLLGRLGAARPWSPQMIACSTKA